MALNIATPIEKRGASLTLTQQFRNKYNITVNEPSQTHFSVQGVQIYSPDEIKTLVNRQKIKGNQKEGTFISLQTYKVDNEIEFLDNAPSNKQKIPVIKAKSKAKLSPAKAQTADKKERAKPKLSINKQMAKANQKVVKLTKEQQKLKRMEDKLSDLTKKYKEEFGDSLKPQKKIKEKQQKKEEQEEEKKSKESGQEPDKPDEGEEFEIEEDQGEQALPTNIKKQGKSLASVTKPQEEEQDVSFEEVEWEPKRSEPSSSRLKASTYSERLGNAVHLLFD